MLPQGTAVPCGASYIQREKYVVGQDSGVSGGRQLTILVPVKETMFEWIISVQRYRHYNILYINQLDKVWGEKV